MTVTVGAAEPARLDSRDEVERWLPHRGAMLLVDRVIEVDSRRVTGEMVVRRDAFWAEGHFPGQPVLPGVLQVEFAAQLAGVLLARGEPPPPAGSLGVFASLRRVSFRRPVLPPATVRGDVTLSEQGRGATTFRFSLTSEREQVADGQFMLAFATPARSLSPDGPRPDNPSRPTH